MKIRMYCVRDHKAGFWPPMRDINDAVAKRNFSYLVNTNKEVGFAPMDYELYYVGEFDDEAGRMIPADIAQFVCSASEVMTV